MTADKHTSPMNRPLTQREKDVLSLLASGKTNAEIGGALGVTEKTVKNVALSLYGKIDVRNRVEAALHFHGIAFRE